MKKVFKHILVLSILLSLYQLNTAQQKLFAGRVSNASSEYDVYPLGWSTYQILGIPNVYPIYGDIEEAYNPAGFGAQRDYIDLEFDNNGPIDSIFIYETFTPGYIDSVFVRNPGTQAWDLVYSAAPDTNLPGSSRILAIGFPMTSYNVRHVKITLANDVSDGWVEIDAVAISPATVTPFVPETTPGSAYQFNGTSDVYHTYSNLLNLITDTGATFTAWVNIQQDTAPSPTDVFNGAAILCDANGTYLGVYLANMGGSDSLYFYNYDGADNYFGMEYTLNTWFHIAWVHQNGFLKAYKNGVLYRTIPSGTTDYIGMRALEMGYNLSSDEYFKGEIDEVTAFNRALSPTEIYDVMRMNVPANMPGLTGYWQMSNCDEFHVFNKKNHIADSLVQINCTISGVPDYTGTQTLSENNSDFKVYPNPTNDVLYIGLNNIEVKHLAIYDITGRVAYQTMVLNNELITLDLSVLSSGIYSLQILDANQKTHKRKIIKN